MIVVIDTNVLISGVLSAEGIPGWILDLLLAREISPAYDDRILTEYAEVLGRAKFQFPAPMVEALLKAIQMVGVQITAAPLEVVSKLT